MYARGEPHPHPSGELGDGGDGKGWVNHAKGVLAPAESGAWAGSGGELGSLGGGWPPAGAEPVEVDEVYEKCLEAGLDYGPAFQGLRGVWRRGEEVFAEVALPEQVREHAGLYGVHPALLDAALHGLGVGAGGGAEGGGAARLPFCWSDVVLCAPGASALRVCLKRVGPDAVSVVAVDEGGALVAAVGSLALRAASVEQLGGAAGAGRDSLYYVDWLPVAAERVSGADPVVAGARWGVLGKGGACAAALRCAGVGVCEYADVASVGQALDGGEEIPDVVFAYCAEGREGDRAGGAARWASAGVDAGCVGGGLGGGLGGVPGVVRAGARGVLGLLQEWLAEERFSDSRLVVVTRGALAARTGERVLDLAGGAVWGLVRSAQAEHPGRFVLVDVDGEESSWGALAAALASGEGSEIGRQVAVREGGLFVPRLAARRIAR